MNQYTVSPSTHVLIHESVALDHPGNSMQQFWDKVDDTYKIDLTRVGHWSGTGIVCFHPENWNITYDD